MQSAGVNAPGSDGKSLVKMESPLQARRIPCGSGASGGGYGGAPNGINAQVRQKRLTLAAKSARFIGSRKWTDEESALALR